MRIAYVCADPGIPVFGCKGCSVHVQEVLREFVRRGHSVDLLAMRTGGDVPADLADVRVHLIPVAAAADRSRREVALHNANRAVRELLSTLGPFDLVYERHALFASAAMPWSAETDTPGVLEVNAPLLAEQAKYRGLAHDDLALAAARESLRAAGTVVAVSHSVAQYVRELRGSHEGVHVVPNGVDPRRFDKVPRRGRQADEFTIGFLGTLKPWHGVDVLLDAFELVHRWSPGARLLIVGDGPQRDALQRRAGELLGDAGSRVEFVGAVAPDDVPRLLARMDVGTAPYADAQDCYFSPLKVLEYMAAGLPVVASDAGQVREMVAHERTGLLVAPGDAAALAVALLTVADDPALCERFGTAARDAVLQRFTWQGVVDCVLRLAGVGARAEADAALAAAPLANL